MKLLIKWLDRVSNHPSQFTI